MGARRRRTPAFFALLSGRYPCGGKNYKNDNRLQAGPRRAETRSDWGENC